MLCAHKRIETNKWRKKATRPQNKNVVGLWKKNNRIGYKGRNEMTPKRHDKQIKIKKHWRKDDTNSWRKNARESPNKNNEE